MQRRKHRGASFRIEMIFPIGRTICLGWIIPSIPAHKIVANQYRTRYDSNTKEVYRKYSPREEVKMPEIRKIGIQNHRNKGEVKMFFLNNNNFGLGWETSPEKTNKEEDLA